MLLLCIICGWRIRFFLNAKAQSTQRVFGLRELFLDGWGLGVL
jgi:hypothetical protein